MTVTQYKLSIYLFNIKFNYTSKSHKRSSISQTSFSIKESYRKVKKKNSKCLKEKKKLLI